MIEKMNLEQFQQIRSQLTQLIKEYEDYDEKHKNDENYDDSVSEQKFVDQYLKIQAHLLDYDLSDIPFDAWKGMVIASDENHLADFSKTRANIDFDLVEYWGKGNFKGCNVRNLDKIKWFLKEEEFDEETIRNNSSLFLSDAFSKEFKEKYYSGTINISDLATLSSEQLDEIKQKEIRQHMDYQENNGQLIETLGIDKVIQLYKYSQEEYEIVNNIINVNSGFSYQLYSEHEHLPAFEEILEQIKNAEISELKNICYSFERKKITNTSRWILQENYPESFVRENSDIFLVDANIPDEVKNRYFHKNLTVQDLIDYPDAFKNIQVDYFMGLYDAYISNFIRDNYGMGKYQEIVQKHSDIFIHLSEENRFYEFSRYLKEGKDLQSVFAQAVKDYCLNYCNPEQFKVISDGQVTFNVPEWLSSMNFQFVDKLNTPEELLQYNDSIFVIDRDQKMTLDTLNIDNIRRFEKETGFFTYKRDKWSRDLEMFSAFSSYFHTHSPKSLETEGIDFKNGRLSYEEFLTQFANCLNYMRKNNVFTDFPSYDWIQGEFRDKHPEIFMDLNAPDELKEAFYKNRITPEFLFQHKGFLKYLVNKNLSNTIRADMQLKVREVVDEQGRMITKFTNFIDEYVSRYGNEKFLQLCAKYGAILSDINIVSLRDEIENEQEMEQLLRNSIYNKILKGKMDYSYLASIPEMMTEYPEIFVNFDNLNTILPEERQRLKKAFYSRKLSFDDIKKYPELANALKDKNLLIAFGNKDGKHYEGRILLDDSRISGKRYSDLEILQVFGNENFLQLCAKYGRYMDGIVQHLNKDVTIKNGKYIGLSQNDTEFQKGLSVEEISKKIESIIVRESKLGNIDYNPDDAPDFLKENYPELFLDTDAPEELKKYFYNYSNKYHMSFEVLHAHKDWLPFLKDKALTTSLLRNHHLKKKLIQYLELFGEEKGIRLGINRAETVKEMMKSNQVELMKNWYDKTGGKFIPDFVVMQNFRLDEADKFLSSGVNWSNLMKIKSFARTPESRDAMLKLAYSFGAFDQDQRGFKKLQTLLTEIPKKIGAEHEHIFEKIDKQINVYSQRKEYFPVRSRSFMDSEGIVHTTTEKLPSDKIEEAYQRMIQNIKNSSFNDLFNNTSLLNLLENLRKENIDVDFSRNIFSQLYRKNEDGSYTLAFYQQNCPKTTESVRSVLESFVEIPMITPKKAHQLFGGFELKYDADFREFLLANLDKIISNPNHIRFVSNVQKQFTDIKAANSNRVLTWELAVSYVQANKYTSVNVGNERVAEISAIAGYSQNDFETLQQIYNYGKQRTFSSIPRIEKTSGKYSYEILRLDDPLAMAIGTLTDCCQELGDCAEVCMEHSMVDKNGRVFVIKDEVGNIVAQSWVWRNKDVICFDNIEIPDKAIVRASKENHGLGRKGFTDGIFSIYKQAAQELIEQDEHVYKELLESGKITQEQYDGLRLGKVTVGLGYNDIAETLKQNATVDKGNITRPEEFVEPVKLSRGLYTNDSTTQYVLEEREDRKEYTGATLPVHNDIYVEYNDSNFSEKALLTLEKLEIVTKEDPTYLDTSVDEDVNKEHLVTEIARNYSLNPETARIVMNPNFAIIYDVNQNELRIGDLLFNTKVDNNEQQMDIESNVVMQIRLALEQIGDGKEINVSSLGDKQKEMYDKATRLTEELDIERGVGHAR